MPRVIGCITEQHDLRLVLVAACICALACGTTVRLLARARTTEKWSSLRWLLTASIVFGFGVWSLHFVAILAYLPGMEVRYDITTTALSIAVVVPGASLAFLAWRYARSRAIGAASGGLLLGLSVAGMHYTGEAAMRLPAALWLDRPMVVASIATGVAFAIVGFARSGALTSLRCQIEAAAWWAVGICGMHFVGMAAISIEPGPPTSETGTVLASGSLAIVVGSVSLAILIVSLAATVMEHLLAERRELELLHLKLVSNIADESLIIERHGIILHANAACGEMFGMPREQLIGFPALDLIAVADHPRVMSYKQDRRNAGGLGDAAKVTPKAVLTLPGDGGAERAPKGIQVLSAKGMALTVEFSRAEIIYEGRPATVMVLRDLPGGKRDEARIRHFAYHDALTDLPNRFLLAERLTHDLAQVDRSGGVLALFSIRLDHLEPAGDALDHATGDALLIEATNRMRLELRAADTLARIGGVEFVVVAIVGHADDVPVLARKLIATMERPFELDGDKIKIGATIGIARYPADGHDQESLMHAANTAQRQARQEPRVPLRFFEASMDETSQAHRKFESDLGLAVERGELVLYFQPLVSCATGDVDGFEALVRWNHPERGLVPPLDFIPLAEETGLIIGIGQWVLETACRSAMSWNTSQRVAVNLSPVQFRQHDLVEFVAATLVHTGLPANRLEIEITEGVFMDQVTRAAPVLAGLRELGVRIALDDFGTGYSSLSYLHSYSFDKLKIDKSFIDRLGQTDGASMIVRTIIELAHGLGLSIIAEGVETPRQLTIVRDLGCDEVQGYLLGRPAPMDAPTELTAARARSLLFGPQKAPPAGGQSSKNVLVM